MNVLIVCDDLFFASQLSGVAQRVGTVPRTALSAAKGLADLNETLFDWVILDLELPRLDVSQFRAAANAHSGCRLLAFGPHVHAELLVRAEAAGVDIVLTRGQVAGRLPDILSEGPRGVEPGP